PRGGVLQVQCAVGQPDVVEDVVHLIGKQYFANVLFDQIAELCGLFNTSAALGAYVQDERAGVAAWKEVLAEEWNQQKCTCADPQKDGDEGRSGPHGSPQHAYITAAHLLEPALESALETGEDIVRRHRIVVVSLQEIHRHRRHQCSRKNVRGQHGEDHR